MIVLQVSAKMCVANGAWSPSICEHQEVQMCQPTMLPMISQIGCWVIAPASVFVNCQGKLSMRAHVP